MKCEMTKQVELLGGATYCRGKLAVAELTSNDLVVTSEVLVKSTGGVGKCLFVSWAKKLVELAQNMQQIGILYQRFKR